MTDIPLTRRDALTAWADFLPTLGRYAHRRNHVEPLHGNVSRLSAALRYRYRYHYALSERRIAALGDVLADGLARAAAHFECPTLLSKDADPAASLCTWATAHALDEVAAFAPTVGPVADLVPRLRERLTAAGEVSFSSRTRRRQLLHTSGRISSQPFQYRRQQTSCSHFSTARNS